MTDQEKKLQGAVYDTALAAAQAGPKPTYAGTFEGQLNDIFDKIQNREKFSYDVNADPLYQSYKDQYIQGGKLAMKDTMGQAAALTGGYGNTYGQQVGQQAYNAYLKNLSAVIPELYDRAYGVYKDEGDDLKDQFTLAGAMRDTEYGRYRDDLGDWEQDRDLAIRREQEDYNRRKAEETAAYQRQQQAYANLLAVIKSSGYMPSAEELAAAGMSAGQANSLRDEFNRQVAAEEAAAALQQLQVMARLNGTSGSGGGSGGSGGGGGSYGGGVSSYNPDTGSYGYWDYGTWVPTDGSSGSSSHSSEDIAAVQEALRQEGYNIAVTGTDNLATRTAAASYVNRDSSAHWSTVNDRSSSSSSSSSSAPQYDWRGIPIAYSPDKVSSEYSSSGMAGGLAGGKEAIKDYAKKR